jgi:hypothetical protein
MGMFTRGRFTTAGRRPAGKRVTGKLPGHTLLAAGGLSVLAHLIVLGPLAAGGGPLVDAPADGVMAVVPLVDATAHAAETPAATVGEPVLSATVVPAPARADTPPRARTPAAAHPRRRRPPPAPTPPAVAAVDPEGAAPPAAPAGAPPAGHPSPAHMLPVALGPRPAPGTVPPPVYLDPDVAQGLRLEDSFPNLPEALRAPGARHVVMAEVCVTSLGIVRSVRIAGEAASRPLGDVLRDAIRGWRYRPLLVDGTPTPFCHLLRIAYQFR